LTLLVAAAATLVATAGAEDKRTYQAELFNAFGLVDGSELRIAGVAAGTVTDLGVTPNKTALITFEVDPGFPELKADASCSSEPQSLIAEYFVDCQPGQSEKPLEGPIPAAHNQTTVQNDLVNNTLREPFKRRLQLIINEFGTGLVANEENLNAAIRSGAPALRELRKVLKILGDQNTIIAELNANSDAVISRLNDRREDVAAFIDEAEDTARASADRREDLARDFELLPDFLEELRPTLVELGNLARESTPLLVDLKGAAPGLNRLAKRLPRFNDATRISLDSLGRASVVGKRALTKARDEIRELDRTSQNAFPAADRVAGFLQSIDDPRNAVEESAFARQDLRQLPGEADRRVELLNEKIPGGPLQNPGYTGLEGVLNYGYIQTLSLNLFDGIGHALSLQIVGTSETSGECGHFSAHSSYLRADAVDEHDRTTDPRDAEECAAILGDAQPDINTPLNLPPYDPSVCPQGSDDLTICDPAGGSSSAASTNRVQSPRPAGAPQAPDVEALLEKSPKDLKPKEIRRILGLPPGVPLVDPVVEGVDSVVPDVGGSTPGTGGAPTNDLLDFLFGS
jgi:ABC-type transporter Mla subunit MlaD